MRARSPIIRRCPCLIGWLAAAAMLVVVPNAVALPTAPASLSSAPGSPTNAGAATFSWGASSPDLGFTIVRYEGGLQTEPDINFGLGQSVARPFPVPGTYTFRVRAVQAIPLDPLVPEQAGPYGTLSVVVDRTPPTISAALRPAGPNGSNGWYRSGLVVDWTCADAGGAGVASCPGDETVATQGAGQTRTGQARDAAGNVSPLAASPAFNFDSVQPGAAPMSAPAAGATVAPEPTFVWGPSPGDATSGIDRYEVLVRVGGTFRAVARVAHVPGTGEYRAKRSPAIYGSAFPANVELRWWVRTYDRAGNQGGSESQARPFRIDPNVPGPPVFTAGPSGPTNVAGPTFAWTGGQPSFEWDVSAAGTGTILLSGRGPQAQALLPPLPDGSYAFAVSQVTAGGVVGIEAVRLFQVDTVAPPAPVITGKPSFPTKSATPAFSWTGEPGSFSKWRVIGADGSAAQSSDTPLTSVAVGPLRPGAYNFRVAQVDAAGNESAPALEPFSIVGGAAGTASLALPRQNARRLRPRAGSTVLTRRPVLRWNGGPAGSKFFNLQVFRVQRARTVATASSVKKIYSVFPSKRTYRMPAVKMLPGTCYVWRVWPYVGSRFTAKPLGVSNFCIASSKRLRAKAAAAAAKRRDRQR